MNKQKAKHLRRLRRKRRVRKNIFGSPAKPRLSVFRSARHIYGQVIDDVNGVTLAAASTRDKQLEKLEATGNKAAAVEVGKLLAARASEAGIKQVAFDRSGYQFHGRVKALADAVRAAGVKM